MSSDVLGWCPPDDILDGGSYPHIQGFEGAGELFILCAYSFTNVFSSYPQNVLGPKKKMLRTTGQVERKD